MKKGAYALFKYFKGILLQCDTVSNNTPYTNSSYKEAWHVAECENEISNKNSIACVSDNKANCSIGCNEESAFADILGRSNVNKECGCQTDSIDDSSSNISRSAFKDLMEDIKLQLMVEMKKMIDENRKEIKDIREEGEKETRN